MKQFIISLICIFAATCALAQDNRSTVLNYDPQNDYTYYKRIEAPGMSKSAIYAKVKKWAMTNLNASDNYLKLDDANNDTIRTMAFLLLPDMPQIQNQTIDYKVLIQFKDGEVIFNASSFIFHGTNKTSGNVYDESLSGIKDVKQPTSQLVIFAFDKKFGDLIKNLETIVKP